METCLISVIVSFILISLILVEVVSTQHKVLGKANAPTNYNHDVRTQGLTMIITCRGRYYDI